MIIVIISCLISSVSAQEAFPTETLLEQADSLTAWFTEFESIQEQDLLRQKEMLSSLPAPDSQLLELVDSLQRAIDTKMELVAALQERHDIQETEVEELKQRLTLAENQSEDCKKRLAEEGVRYRNELKVAELQLAQQQRKFESAMKEQKEERATQQAELDRQAERLKELQEQLVRMHKPIKPIRSVPLQAQSSSRRPLSTMSGSAFSDTAVSTSVTGRSARSKLTGTARSGSVLRGRK